jgi:signal transduction histidine kinase
MKAALVVSLDDALRSRVIRELEDHSVFIEVGAEGALRTLRTTEMDLVLVDVMPPIRGLSQFIARTRHLSPSAVVVCLYPGEGLTPEDREALEAADFLLAKPFTRDDLALILRQAHEKQGLLLEVSALRARPPVTGRALLDGAKALSEAASPGPAPVLKQVAKALSAGFDLPRLLDLFLEAVGEMVKPSRSALLLADEAGSSFTVRGHRGLAPHVVASARLSAESGLPFWLQTQGRLIHAEEAAANAQDPQVRDIAREFGMLQAVVAVPLIAHGNLVAILTLGQRITGVPYSHDETEVLFNLATHLATAIGNIRLHHQLQYQKVYNERILSHMSSGVVTIDRQQTVTMMNRRAEEILEVPATEVLSRDLRVLPSPLGDLLYESLVTGRVAHRMEIALARPKLPLEVSTYPIAGDDPAPLGAVMVFDDLSAAKQLAEEKRQAELYQLLTRVVARMADEIKNPLVSIHTFMELLEDRFEEVEFRERFAAVVGRDVRRLVEIFEKMSALVTEREFKFEAVDVRELVDECVAGLGTSAGSEVADSERLRSFTDAASGKRVAMSLHGGADGLVVKGDRGQLKKALSYLVWFLMRRSPGEEAKLSISIERPSEEAVQVLMASRTAQLKGDELHRIFDPVKVVQESLIDVGPCVSQRIVEAHGGRLQARQGRHEVSFLLTLPATPA